MIWPFSRQIDQAQVVLDLLTELHVNINDQVASADAVEAERVLRHMLKALRAHIPVGGAS